MENIKTDWKRDLILVAVLAAVTLILIFKPSGFETNTRESVRCRGRVIKVDNADVKAFGVVRVGMQDLTIRILDGPFKGREVDADNQLVGKLELDKFFEPGDTALVVLSLKDGDIYYAVAQDHYRLGLELVILVLFAALLIAFGGWTGLKALLSFIFAGAMIWKVLLPSFLLGYDPILVSLGVVAILTAAIVFLVGGVNRRGLAAFLGAMSGLAVTCLLAMAFGSGFRLHGAVKPFSETLLYAGFQHLSLTRIFMAGIFMAASGAVMDLAMDVSASMHEVSQKNPGLSFREILGSGLAVGRAVVGTMTTTLLLAYSAGYASLLMVFMAQGVPLANLFNLNYVSAEVLNTLVGSFGLVTVAPFTALIGAMIFSRTKKAPRHVDPAEKTITLG